jgi:hypothetical protein
VHATAENCVGIRARLHLNSIDSFTNEKWIHTRLRVTFVTSIEVKNIGGENRKAQETPAAVEAAAIFAYDNVRERAGKLVHPEATGRPE